VANQLMSVPVKMEGGDWCFKATRAGALVVRE
jgi:hypothetical protein